MIPYVTVTAAGLQDASGAPLSGVVTFMPVAVASAGQSAQPVFVTDPTDSLVIGPEGVTRQVSGGQFTVRLAATDYSSLSPTGWAYQVTMQIAGGVPPASFTFLLPHSPSSVDYSALVPATPAIALNVTGVAEVNGQTGSVTVTPAMIGATPVPASAENVIYVSAAGMASDSNSGLAAGIPKATIAAALTALGSGGGIIQLGVGFFPLGAADGHGNGVTLTSAGVKLRGRGAGITVITIAAAVTWGVQCQAALCEVSDLEVRFIAGGSATYGIGVDTPGSTGSAEVCRFRRLLVQDAGGTHVNSYAVGPAHTGSGSVDIADTTFWDSTGVGPSAACWLVGNGTPGNILGTHAYGCQALGGQYGVRLAAGDITWHGGGFGENTAADIRVEGSNGAPVLVSGFRSESSARLLSATAVATAATIAIRDATWISGDSAIASGGDVITSGLSGTLTLDSALILNLGSIVPVFVLGNGAGPLAVTARGCSVSAPLATLFSATPAGEVSVTASAYVQLTGAGGFAGSAAGPVRLGPSNVITNYNGTGRDTLSPTETILLASSGAVAIAGVCEIADITLSANATSSSVAALYLGQRITIAWRQDATGGRTYAWPSICRFYGGSAPAASTAPHAVDAVNFWFDGTSLIQAL